METFIVFFLHRDKQTIWKIAHLNNGQPIKGKPRTGTVGPNANPMTVTAKLGLFDHDASRCLFVYIEHTDFPHICIYICLCFSARSTEVLLLVHIHWLHLKGPECLCTWAGRNWPWKWIGPSLVSAFLSDTNARAFTVSTGSPGRGRGRDIETGAPVCDDEHRRQWPTADTRRCPKEARGALRRPEVPAPLGGVEENPEREKAAEPGLSNCLFPRG